MQQGPAKRVTLFCYRYVVRQFYPLQRDLKDNALRAISTALQETRLYYRDRQCGKERDLEVEAQLVRYWSAAAIPLRHIDEELAMICEHKAEFWINPEDWSHEEIVEFGIKLGDVTKAYRKLAMPGFRKMGIRE